MYAQDSLLRAGSAEAVLGRGTPGGADVYLFIGSLEAVLARQRYDRVDPSGGPGFPTQYFGLKTYYHGAVKDLCLVAEADAPASMGGVLKVNKNGTLYGVYLVETTDPNASPCYIRTSTGTKAIREKT